MIHDPRPITYIHRLPDWPHFRWDHAAISAQLGAVRHRQGVLLGRMEALGFRLRQETVLDVLVQDVARSSAIEGERLDEKQVRTSIARRLGMDIAGLPRAARDVEGVVEMMLDATQAFDRPLTKERLWDWHASLFPTGRNGMHRIIVGAWRDDSEGPMQVVSGPIGKEQVHFEAPPAEEIDDQMASFLEWFEKDHPDLDPVVTSAIAHLWFVTIHPFDDGNGRIGRAIMDLALARADRTSQRFYSMSAQIHREKDGYYTELERTQKRDLDITPWIQWFLTQLGRALDAAEEVLATVRLKTSFWTTYADVSMNERQRKVLNRLLDGFEGKMTSGKWAKIAKCSQDTAHRDIVDLIAKGVMKQDEGGGRSTSYSIEW